MSGTARMTAQVPDDFCLPQPLTSSLPRVETSWLSDSTLDQAPQPIFGRREKLPSQMTPGREESPSPASSQRSSIVLKDPVDSSRAWHLWTFNFPLIASFLGIFIIGTPVAAIANEDRILDGCVLWFVWASTLRLQRELKTSSICNDTSKLMNAIVTLMNPVLFTTLMMTAYTRAKTCAYGFDSLPEVLRNFSSGTPLYALWTSVATGTPLSDGRSPWFGAGDAALSILECGILIWGFKLYECQRQLFSLAGLLTVLLATAAAAANVFLSVLAGSFVGLDAPEALAFAARSTTLALAKPAMAALGGNLGVNAALVVSNGILGQLCYPFVLDKLGVKREDKISCSSVSLPDSDGKESRLSLRPLLKTAQQDLASGDDPFTISAGIAVGINGAAMGVSYLYETRSRAAPYAALAMTVSGVMTVVFTTVEPFKGVVLSLAS
jgi:putative effector of murein hydrolase